ncbi:MAG: FecR domain-containing protein [Lachnospiraceae bacterium]|nr:FecR domain-containing protein [Lachnospiraceae bacterium]
MDTEKKSVKKNLIIIIIAVAVSIIAIVIGCLFYFKQETYRVLKIYQVEGQANVVHEDGSEVTPYDNMLLQSGDTVSLAVGKLIIKADEDKFIYLENNTKIILRADGTIEDSKTTIQLLEGAVINHIEAHLSDKSVYEVNTQNSTMSVRGTIVRSEKSSTDNGTDLTLNQTFEGTTVSQLVNPDNSKGEERTVNKGEQVQIYSDSRRTDFVGPNEPIDNSTLDLQTLEYLKMISENSNRKLSVSSDVIDDLLDGDQGDPGPFKVDFIYNNTVFGTVTVNKGDKVKEPLLMPTAKGHWKFDFDNTTITEATRIEWVAEQ